jgi:thiamine biosynthesis protein ThiS
MKVTLNGKAEQLQDKINVADLLVSRKIRPEMVSVELNGAIVHRGKFATTELSEGDKVEFLYYMGGGSSGFTVYGVQCTVVVNRKLVYRKQETNQGISNE